MGNAAAEMDRSVKTVDQRLAEATTPLKEGVTDLNAKLDRLTENFKDLASAVDKLDGEHKDTAALTRVAVKTLGFDIKEK